MKKFEMQMITTDILCEKHNRYMIRMHAKTPAVCLDCQLEKKAQDDLDHQKKVTSDLLELKYKSIKLPPRHRHCKFSNYIVKVDGQNIAINHAVDYAKKIVSGESCNIIFSVEQVQEKRIYLVQSQSTLLKIMVQFAM